MGEQELDIKVYIGDSLVGMATDIDFEIIPAEHMPNVALPTTVQICGTMQSVWWSERLLNKLFGIKNKRKKRYKQLERARSLNG